MAFIQEDAFENVVSKIVAIFLSLDVWTHYDLVRPQWVNIWPYSDVDIR